MPPTSHWVPRPRLVRRLLAPPRPRVVVATAPAGFGKTTLLVQWEKHRDEDRPFIWVTPARDDEASDVVAAIARKVRAAGLDLDPTSPPFVVVVDDDAPRPPRHRARRLVTTLAPILPRGATIALATRVAPELPASLPAWGPLVTFGPSDFAMTRWETTQLLRAIRDEDSSADVLPSLGEEAEGWPAVVCVAASSLEIRVPAVVGAPPSLAHAAHVRDFVASEVMASLDDETIAFASQISVVDRATPDLCAAVAGRDDVTGLLGRLARSQLLVEEVEDDTTWYRCHRVVSGVLRHRLAAGDPATMSVLHGRAARWFADAGFVDAAFHHAHASGELSLLRRLVARHWSHHVLAGAHEDARAWLRACGDDATDDPALALAGVWLGGLAGERDTVDRLLPIAATAPADLATDGFAATRSALALVRLFLTARPLSRTLSAVDLAAATEAGHATPWEATALLAQGWIRYLMGLPAARVAFREAREAADAGQWRVRRLAEAGATLAAADDGDLDDARASSDTWPASLPDHPHMWALHVARGAILARAEAPSSAVASLQQGTDLARAISHMSPWPPVVALEHLTRARLALGDRRGAMSAIDEAQALLAAYGRDDSVFVERVARLHATAGAMPPELGTDLSDRELQVLRLLAGQLQRHEIACQLGVSTNTVKTHVRSLYRKLGAGSRPDAVHRARQRALL